MNNTFQDWIITTLGVLVNTGSWPLWCASTTRGSHFTTEKNAAQQVNEWRSALSMQKRF